MDGVEFDRRIRPLLPVLQRYARRLRRDETAQDLVQDTLLRAWSSRHSFQPGTNLAAWLTTIMRNAFLTTLARERRQYRLLAPALDVSVPPSQEGRVALNECEAALARLPPALRDALVAVGVEGFSTTEAASRCGITPGALKSRVFRARQTLAACLAEG